MCTRYPYIFFILCFNTLDAEHVNSTGLCYTTVNIIMQYAESARLNTLPPVCSYNTLLM